MVQSVQNNEILSDYFRRRLCNVKVYFSLIDFCDQNLLRKECSKAGLNISFLDDFGLNGVVGVSLNVIPLWVSTINWFEVEIRNRFKTALTHALKNTNNEDKIEQHLRQTEFAHNFCYMISLISKRIKEGKEDIERIKRQIIKYEPKIGSDGVNLFLKIFQENDFNKILNKYSSYNEFLLKKYQIELFIAQQVNQIYLTVFSINPELIKQNKNHYYISIIGLEEYHFELVNWAHPLMHQRAEVYVCKNVKNIVALPIHDQVNKTSQFLIATRLLLNCVCSGIHVVKDILEQEKSDNEDCIESIPIQINSIKDNLVSADSAEISEIQNIILAYQNTLNSKLIEFYKPIKKDFQRYNLKKHRMDSLIEDQLTKIPMRSNGETIAVEKVQLPAKLGVNLPSKEITSVYNLVISQEKNVLRILDVYRGLNADLEKLKHVKRMMECQISEAEQRVLKEKESRLLNAISTSVETIKNICDILKGKIEP